MFKLSATNVLIFLWILSFFYLVFDQLALILLVVFLSSSLLFTHHLLIFLGLNKGPILQYFEKYGDEEDFHYPFPALFLWLGIFFITGSIWLSVALEISFGGEIVGLALLLFAAVTQRFSGFIRKNPHRYLIYPRWLYNLQMRTSRLERRRLAYMWLRLPWRARLTYNSSDRAFLQWADFIILSTLM